MNKKPSVEVYQRADGLFDWRLRASNGQIIATSGGQGYVKREEAAAGWIRTQDAAEFITEIRDS